MTVKELIEELRKIRNQNLEVVFEELDGTYTHVDKVEMDSSHAVVRSLWEN